MTAESRRTREADRGTSQTGGRLYNERLVLSLLRDHGRLAMAELARRTGLTAQTISTIVRRLEADGLISRERPVRGRVGQPSVPLVLRPDGAFSLGLHFGRRSGALFLLDLTGAVRAERHTRFAYPTPARLLRFTRQALRSILAGLSADQAARIAGLGLAIPFQLWEWEEEVGAPTGALGVWRDFDIRAALAGLCPWPIHLCNDANAACAAELVFGNPGGHANFVYFFIASLIGGGVVTEGALQPGRTGLGGAIGTLPVPAPPGSGMAATGLIRRASLFLLEAELTATGQDPGLLWTHPGDWRGFEPALGRWIEHATDALAYAVLSALAIFEFQAVVVDGAFPATVRARVVERLRMKIAERDLRGLPQAVIVEGSVGGQARALGAAALPLIAQFSRDREVLFKEPA
ncbi:MAG: hypothetical protein B7X08_01690 [Acidocella sp. 20-63-7]|nr:MAG: hypothetical protein B7X08_01690 [Acidocella sp. 20-63-7]